MVKFIFALRVRSGPGSSVDIATDYGLDGPGIETRCERDFPPVQIGPGAHPASCKMGTGSFPGVKFGRGVLLTTHPLLAPRSWKSRAIPLPPLGHNRACNGVTSPLPFIGTKKLDDKSMEIFDLFVMIEKLS
jgi:hypothetical protein